MPEKPITNFRNEYAFLSNFYQAEFTTSRGIVCPTVEHAFQACKTDDPAQRLWVLEADSPSQAKQRGRHVNLRPNWDKVKVKWMYQLVYMKFKQNPRLASKLMVTGEAFIAEHNYWGDRFWGIDARTGEGHNELGKILMEVRKTLRKEGV
jgi:ribA/ribD-fused uncharacterized protein